MPQVSEQHTAIVARRDSDPRKPGLYLQLSEAGAPTWTADPLAATAFESMREAMRAACRLPAAACAFGVPRQTELLVARDLH